MRCCLVSFELASVAVCYADYLSHFYETVQKSQQFRTIQIFKGNKFFGFLVVQSRKQHVNG
jgi:hypothetical protein